MGLVKWTGWQNLFYPGVILDFNENGQVVGIELLGLSKRIEPEMLRILQFETV